MSGLNFTSSSVDTDSNEWDLDNIFMVIILSVIIIFTIVGNVLVILSVFTYRPLRIVQNFFIVSLAVADLTVAVFVLPFNVAYSIIGKWIFGIHLCEMWLTCDIMCCTASILNLCAIALDRYWAITDPIIYAQKRTLKRVLIMIGLVWGLSFAISLPPLLGWNDWPDTFVEETPCALSEEKGFILYSSLGSFFCPLVFMSIMYIKIYKANLQRLRKQSNSCNGKTVADTPECDTVSLWKTLKTKLTGSRDRSLPFSSTGTPRQVETSFTDHKPTNQNSQQDNPQENSVSGPRHDSTNTFKKFLEDKHRISLTKERRLARTLAAIMGCFVVCWLPFFLTYVIMPFCPSCTKLNERHKNIVTWLGYCNSTINPVIYTIFNKDFKRSFISILKCRITCWRTKV
ncbi:tyramine/octopamine receptor-like [Homarus americanus]|uniref:Octopamine receptor-like n=1 Tax=Homarus americanus TaxID=6706 RepID=A0A8J5K1U2_HOMAM|nr:tyramine/octopamine receptor-like [Homarus americanus]XP_042227500.1 tyramine/octopamine receptor-like [Homarus americanus]KAG7165944.1 Octopamine receptor-like [Homarus americanus]